MSFFALLARLLLAALLTFTLLAIVSVGAGAAGVAPYWGEVTIKRGDDPHTAALDLYLHDPAHGLSAPLVRNLPRSIRPNIAWSPDGRHVRFSNWIESDCGYVCEYDLLTGRLETAPENRLLAGYRQVTRSPDNGQIAYTDETTVYLFDIASERSHRLISDVWMPQLGWSPAGDSLAFVSYQSPDPYNGALWRVDVATRRAYRLDCACIVTGAPVWSPAGDLIIFEGYRPGESHQLFATDAALQTAHPLTAFPQTPTLGFVEGSWSPDGEQFAFQMIDRHTNAEMIYLVSRAGGDTRLLSEGIMPTWSRDGGWIMFTARGEQTNQLYVIRPDGSDRRFLTTTAASSVDIPRWRP